MHKGVIKTRVEQARVPRGEVASIRTLVHKYLLSRLRSNTRGRFLRVRSTYPARVALDPRRCRSRDPEKYRGGKHPTGNPALTASVTGFLVKRDDLEPGR